MAAGLTQEFAAIVLTGGLSRRMGTDKASLVVDGVAMVDRVLAVLDQVGITTVAVAGSPQVPDPEPEQGPMAGIVAGWRHLSSAPDGAVEAVAVLACDLPSLSAHVVRELCTQSLEHAHGAVAHDGERHQPLIAAYRPVALDEIDKAFVNGQRSVRKCFTDWDLATVNFAPGVLADADTPDDLRGFRVQWPS